MNFVILYSLASDPDSPFKISDTLICLFCVHVCECVWECILHGAPVEVGGQLSGLTSLLPPRGFWEQNSDLQAWRQVPLILSHLTSPTIPYSSNTQILHIRISSTQSMTRIHNQKLYYFQIKVVLRRCPQTTWPSPNLHLIQGSGGKLPWVVRTPAGDHTHRDRGHGVEDEWGEGKKRGREKERVSLSVMRPSPQQMVAGTTGYF